MSDLIVSRTVPVPLGPQTPENSIPVVLAGSDDVTLSVKEVQPETEVALSLLGIPRAETTLGVFSDVTTYGIDSEIWSSYPEVYTFENGGVTFLENRSAGLLEAVPGSFAMLNTNRAFPYLPGRVSSSTFGLRSRFQNAISMEGLDLNQIQTYYDTLSSLPIRKWGQFGDKNGYYFECRGTGQGDNFLVVRRTDGIPKDFLGERYMSGHPDQNLYKLTGATVTQVPSSISADNLHYFHAVLNDQSLEVKSNFTNRVQVYDPKISDFRYVKPENALVYEFRVPRSWFNFDQLNGLSNNQQYYSDVITIDGVKKYPGQVITGSFDNSVREIDFSKVTMYKTEYSWYGAIGCIFLTYVPVLESTARWVKAHYLRGSNQLSFPTLGNPYLPMTFYVQNPSGNIHKEGLEKYGASYFIDGADKGSVRVFSIINEAGVTVTPGVQTPPLPTAVANCSIFADQTYSYIHLPTIGSSPAWGRYKTFLIGGYVLGQITVNTSRGLSSIDISPGSIFVTDVKTDLTNSYMFFNKSVFDELPSTEALSITFTNFRIVTPRGKYCLGIKMKREIGPNNVVSKSTVFPVRLNTGTGDDVATTYRIVKNARLPEPTQTIGNMRVGFVVSPTTIEPDIREIPIQFYVKGQEFTYSNSGKCTIFLRGIPGSFRKRYRIGNTLTGWFTRYEPGEKIELVAAPNSTTDLLTVNNATRGFDVGIQESGYTAAFVDSQPFVGGTVPASETPDTYSAVTYTVAEDRMPLVNTGQTVASLITGPKSADDFDLTPYFGFNKEFLAGSGLSLDTVFDDELVVIGNTFDTSGVATAKVITNLSWEEQ